MGTGAFRDAGAALERVRALDDDVERLKAENASLRERSDALLAGLDSNKLGAELRKAIQERDALRRENEHQQIANITVVQRMKEEARALERSYEAKLAALRVGIDPTSFAREQAYIRDAAANEQQLAALTKERDELARRVCVHPADGNVSAVLQRAIEEREDLLRELDALRTKQAATKKRTTFFGRLFA